MLGTLLLCRLPSLIVTIGMATESMHLALMWHQESPELVGNKWVNEGGGMHVSTKRSTTLLPGLYKAFHCNID